MKQYLTEFDELQAALKQVKMDEPVMSYYKGRLVENEDSYNKIQKLLDCPQMSQSHRFLYDLDVENLQEGEIDKVNALFDLGVKKGYIDNSFEEEFDKEENPTAVIADEPEPAECCGRPDCCHKAPIACWTILYSATKNGEIKTGECYSNAISVSAAKADCLAKLSRFGYENVSVLAIEAGDPDLCGCNEDDLLKDRPHNAHVSVNEDGESDGEEIGETSKNPYVAGMKVVNGGKPASATKNASKPKKVQEDDDGEASAEDDTDAGEADDASDDAEGSADDSGADKADDTSSDDSASDDSEGSDDDSGAGSEDTSSDDEGSDGDEADDGEGSDGSDDEDSEDDESDDSEDDSEGEEDGEGESGGSEESDKDLTDEEKAQYKDEYKRAFKETMLKCKFEDKCFNDLTIDQKVEFFTKLSEKWTKADPKKFMSDKEEDQLEAIIATK